jgi:DNA mismatch repair protein MutS
MCHIGSFVPASACKIGLVDKILTMIHLSDTINEDSGIGEELQDLSRIFRLATNKSLILIDEFAKSNKLS